MKTREAASDPVGQIAAGFAGAQPALTSPVNDAVGD
jgi:hypothetical protein